MRRLRGVGFALCMLCLVVILSGCSGASEATDYSASIITWGDVNRKFIELEQERVTTMEALKDKPSLPASKPVQEGGV